MSGQLRKRYKLMSLSDDDPPLVNGRRSVSGLTGLVRYHCETVISSMVATSLDQVSTSIREDMVSSMIYSRFHSTLATKLAVFTQTLATMLSGQSFRANSLSSVHMELQHLISNIIEAVIDAESSLYNRIHCSELIETNTYEDALAVAVINAVLNKYSEDDIDERIHLIVKDAESKGLEKNDKEVANNTQNSNFSHLKEGSGSKNNNHENVESDSLSSSDISSSSSTSSSSSSLSSTSCSSSSSSEDMTPPHQSLPPYDSSLELYLSPSDHHTDNNWSLKQAREIPVKYPLPVFSMKRFNLIENLTDDVKRKLREERRYCGDECDLSQTEEQFYNSVYDMNKQFLRLGDEIGESSTDDLGADSSEVTSSESYQLVSGV